jgi:hypothetical protein
MFRLFPSCSDLRFLRSAGNSRVLTTHNPSIHDSYAVGSDDLQEEKEAKLYLRFLNSFTSIDVADMVKAGIARIIVFKYASEYPLSLSFRTAVRTSLPEMHKVYEYSLNV